MSYFRTFTTPDKIPLSLGTVGPVVGYLSTAEVSPCGCTEYRFRLNDIGTSLFDSEAPSMRVSILIPSTLMKRWQTYGFFKRLALTLCRSITSLIGKIEGIVLLSSRGVKSMSTSRCRGYHINQSPPERCPDQESKEK